MLCLKPQRTAAFLASNVGIISHYCVIVRKKPDVEELRKEEINRKWESKEAGLKEKTEMREGIRKKGRAETKKRCVRARHSLEISVRFVLIPITHAA